MSTKKYARELVKYVQAQFVELADPERAPAMAAYMKTDKPFYGIANPARLPVYKEMKQRFPASDLQEYQAGILALWNLPYREEKYAALHFAVQNDRFISAESVPLYERLIREGAWWDLVDEIATHLSGRALLRDRANLKQTIERWTEDPDMWIRRSAMISQVGHKTKTDAKQLFKHSRLLASEQEFFIRKAIGWALRDYSWSNPDAVIKFFSDHGAKLSPLSRREGAKRLIAAGLLDRDAIK